MYRGYYLRICGKASGIMPVLGKFFKLVCIEGITYVSVERPVELCQYWGNSSTGMYRGHVTYVSVERPVELCQYCGNSSKWYA